MAAEERDGMIIGIEAPIYLKYNFTAGAAPTRFLTQSPPGRRPATPRSPWPTMLSFILIAPMRLPLSMLPPIRPSHTSSQYLSRL